MVKLKRKSSVPDEGEGLTLPTEKTKPCDELQDYSILLYGAKKIGKTSLGSMFPDAFFMFCEPGGKALSTFARPVKNWVEFKTYVRLICKDKKFKNVIIDTADYAYEYCVRFVCARMAIDHPSDLEWGKGWKAVALELNTEITKLMHSGKGVIFVSHSRDLNIKKRDGTAFDKTSSSLAGQAKEALEGIVDIWAYYHYDGNKRVLVIQGDDYIDAGHRVEGRFRYSDGTSVRAIPMGANKEEAYKNFMDAFENKLEKGVVTAVKPKIKLKLRR